MQWGSITTKATKTPIILPISFSNWDTCNIFVGKLCGLNLEKVTNICDFEVMHSATRPAIVCSDAIAHYVKWFAIGY